MIFKSILKFLSKTVITIVAFTHCLNVYSQSLNIHESGSKYQVSVNSEGESIDMPTEGLWSIATTWKEDWPANWNHAAATFKEK